MENDRVRGFAFKRGLYSISSKLTTADVSKMRFILSDLLPRQQLERTRSGFDLLCLMASKEDLLSYNDHSFLEEVLREVGKGDYVKYMSINYPCPDLRPSIAGSDSVSRHLRPKLSPLKSFLREIGDHLTYENVHDVACFFSGICESINYQNVEDIKSAEQLFTRLFCTLDWFILSWSNNARTTSTTCCVEQASSWATMATSGSAHNRQHIKTLIQQIL